MNVYKKDGKIIFEFPEEQQRQNPYMDDFGGNTLGTFPTFTGLIIHHLEGGNDYDEIGFAYTIDMEYKGKDDQFSEIVVHWNVEPDRFKEICDGLEIPYIEFSNCSTCGSPLLGSFSVTKKGNQCFECTHTS